MRLYKKRKGITTPLKKMVWTEGFSSIKIYSSYIDGRTNDYELFIEPRDYLGMAKSMLNGLGKVAGIEYGIFIRPRTGMDWTKI